jgi:peptidyl-prolyl cis-trans isomerase A (cyclophilin A)
MTATARRPAPAPLMAIALAVALASAACGKTAGDPQPPLTPPTQACSAAGVAASDAAVAADAGLTTVCLLTSQGEFVVALDARRSPLTVANFLTYVGEGFYDGLLFHRVLAGFVVQGGGYTPSEVYRPPSHAAIPLESQNGWSNLRGTLAMARTSVPDSATTQFFVNLVDDPALDFVSTTPGQEGYAVFGQVIAGMASVDRIAALPTFQGSMSSYQPYPLVILYWAKRLQ